MSERTPQSVINAAMTAESEGVHVNWKAICLELVQAFMAELARREEEAKVEDQDE